ncbi:MAG TPA: MFS transporter [Spirillospora sp.]
MNTSRRKGATLATCMPIAAVPGIDLTALNLAVPHLSADLNPSSTQILWIADAYGFALAGLLITMGAVGDRIGHKRLLLCGTALFAAASAVTAYAPTAEALIAARAVLGVAGATLMPSCLSLIRRAFTDAGERTAAVGAFMGVSGLAIGLGPLVGGVLLDRFWWGSVFLINVPIMAVALIVGAAVLTETRDAGSREPVPGRLDLLSVPLSAAGVLGVVYAIKEAAAHGLGHGRIYVSAAAGALALVAFVVRQARLDEPLIDIALFRRTAFAGSVAANTFAMFALVAQSLIFSLFFQLALGWSPLKAGLAGLPGAAGAMAGGAVLAPPLISALGRARAAAAGMLLGAAGYAVFVTVGLDTSYWMMLPAMVLSGAGVGIGLTVTGDTVLASVPKERSGAASAISETGMEFGGALGLAVLGSVLNAVYRGVLDLPAGVPAPAASAARDSLGAALQAAAALPADLAARVGAAARDAFVDGMHAALVCSAAFAVLVAVFALVTLRDVPTVIADAGEPERTAADADTLPKM